MADVRHGHAGRRPCTLHLAGLSLACAGVVTTFHLGRLKLLPTRVLCRLGQ